MRLINTIYRVNGGETAIVVDCIITMNHQYNYVDKNNCNQQIDSSYKS